MITKLHKKKLLALPTPGAAGRCMETSIDLDNVLYILSNLDEWSGISFSVDIEMLKTEGIPTEIRTELMESIAKIDQLETEVGIILPELRTYHPTVNTPGKTFEDLTYPCHLTDLEKVENYRALCNAWKSKEFKPQGGFPKHVKVNHIIPKSGLSAVVKVITELPENDLKNHIYQIIGKPLPGYVDGTKDTKGIAEALFNFGPNLFATLEKREDDPGETIDIYALMTEENTISQIPKINLYGFQIITDAIMSTYTPDPSSGKFIKKVMTPPETDRFHKQLEIGFKFLAIARVLHKKIYIFTKTYMPLNDDKSTAPNTGPCSTPPASPTRPSPKRTPPRSLQNELKGLARHIRSYLNGEDSELVPTIKILIKAGRTKEDLLEGIRVIAEQIKPNSSQIFLLKIEQDLNPRRDAEATPEKKGKSGPAARALFASSPIQDITNIETEV